MSWGKKDKKETDSSENSEEVKIEPASGDFEVDSEEQGSATLADKLKKLRAELEKCKEEKQEYLVGWQRCKADSINARKEGSAADCRARSPPR